MNSVLPDTNVLIYSIDEDSKNFLASQNLLYNSKINLFTSSKKLSEMLAVLIRYPKNKISTKKAIDIIKAIMNYVKVLFPNQESNILFFELLLKHKPTGLKIHDFEILSIALANNIDYIATFNVKDFNDVNGIKFYPFKI